MTACALSTAISLENEVCYNLMVKVSVCVTVQGDKAYVSGFPEENRQNSCNTYAEVTAHTCTYCICDHQQHKTHSCLFVMKPAGAAAVPSVENGGVCDSASGSVFKHTPWPPWPHTPVLRSRHITELQRIHTEGMKSTPVMQIVHMLLLW